MYNSYSGPALDQPWNKPWNDQPWKRDLLKLDSSILKEKQILSELKSQSKYKNVSEKMNISSEKLRTLESKRDRMVTNVR